MFRIDDRILTQLVATLAETDGEDRRKALQDLVKKFRP